MERQARGRMVFKNRPRSQELLGWVKNRDPRGWVSMAVVGQDRITYIQDRAALLGISERELCQRLLLEKIDQQIRAI
jgi:hypothetical protein